MRPFAYVPKSKNIHKTIYTFLGIVGFILANHAAAGDDPALKAPSLNIDVTDSQNAIDAYEENEDNNLLSNQTTADDIDSQVVDVIITDSAKESAKKTTKESLEESLLSNKHNLSSLSGNDNDYKNITEDSDNKEQPPSYMQSSAEEIKNVIANKKDSKATQNENSNAKTNVVESVGADAGANISTTVDAGVGSDTKLNKTNNLAQTLKKDTPIKDRVNSTEHPAPISTKNTIPKNEGEDNTSLASKPLSDSRSLNGVSNKSLNANDSKNKTHTKEASGLEPAASNEDEVDTLKKHENPNDLDIESSTSQTEALNKASKKSSPLKNLSEDLKDKVKAKTSQSKLSDNNGDSGSNGDASDEVTDARANDAASYKADNGNEVSKEVTASKKKVEDKLTSNSNVKESSLSSGKAASATRQDENTVNTDKAQDAKQVATNKDSSIKSANNALGEKSITENILYKHKKVSKRLYTPSYLKNMYLPYFRSIYELPQELSQQTVLRAVTVLDDSPVLVYNIGVSDAVGPLDLDASANDNRIIKTFCQITLSEAILHRLERVDLLFYHGDDVFFTRSLTVNDCLSKDGFLIEKKLYKKEQDRLDNEFIYAYEQQKSPMLSLEYLANQFVPYAIDRIGETFFSYEKSPQMTLEQDGSIAINFTYTSHKKRLPEEVSIKRVKRTCAIGTYKKFLLPRIVGLTYRYIEPDGNIFTEVKLNKNTCALFKKPKEQKKVTTPVNDNDNDNDSGNVSANNVNDNSISAASSKVVVTYAPLAKVNANNANNAQGVGVNEVNVSNTVSTPKT